MNNPGYYVREVNAAKWCISGAPNRTSLCGKRALGHAWPHTERVLPKDAEVCEDCAAKFEEISRGQ